MVWWFGRLCLLSAALCACGRLHFEDVVPDANIADGSGLDASLDGGFGDGGFGDGALVDAHNADGGVLDDGAVDGNLGDAGPPFSGCNAVASIPQDECDALVSFHAMAGGNGWTTTSGWLRAADPCDWSGVTCTSGRVTELSVQDAALSGRLSSRLGDLMRLQRLTVASPNTDNTTLGGTIPGELADIATLIYVDLHGNALSGSLPSSGSATALREVNVSDNQLSGSIPIDWDNLAQLQVLNASDNQLSGSIDHLGQLRQLRVLDLHANAFDGTLPGTFGSIITLQELNLSENRLTGGPSQFSAPPGLRVVLLNDNRLNGPVSAAVITLPVTQIRLRGQTGCLTADIVTANWLGSRDPLWNDGC